MFPYLLSSVTLFCCINVICSNVYCSENCYKKSYVVHRNPTTWYQAYVACLEAGMEFATVESDEEEYRLEKTLDQQNALRSGIGNGYWLSARRRKGINQIVWYTNGRSIVYNKYTAGQPDRASEKEECIEIYIGPKTKAYGWNDHTCNRSIGYICQTYTLQPDCIF